MKKIKPLGNKIVVERKEAPPMKGSIFLPESAKEKPRQGVVVAVGPGKSDEKGKVHSMDVKVGDQILFSSYAGTEYQSGEKDFLILSEEDVLAVLD